MGKLSKALQPEDNPLNLAAPQRASMSGNTILIIEDDPQIAEAMAYRLRAEGFAVLSAPDASAADRQLATVVPDLVILDIGLPGEDGFSWIHRHQELLKMTPVLMLTARGKTEDKVAGLGLGADDYLTKPFEFAELLARIAAILRRRPASIQEEIKLGELTIQRGLKRVLLNGGDIDLSPREYDVLMILASQPQRVMSKSQILQHLADQDLKAADLNDSAIEVIIHRLRKKIESAKVEIETARGFGYLLKPTASAPETRKDI